jgi:hypothetical protein
MRREVAANPMRFEERSGGFLVVLKSKSAQSDAFSKNAYLRGGDRTSDGGAPAAAARRLAVGAV